MSAPDNNASISCQLKKETYLTGIVLGVFSDLQGQPFEFPALIMASGPTGRLDPGLARAEDAETFDAFNDDTFGGGGEGDEWNEDAHEALAAMTEEEMKAVQGGG